MTDSMTRAQKLKRSSLAASLKNQATAGFCFVGMNVSLLSCGDTEPPDRNS